MTQQNKDRLIGKVIDNFEIQEVLGRGGMGIVYRAYHPALQLSAAVKIMRPDLALQSGFYERFLQEARTIARLEHPNIVDVINFGRYEDSYYLMMDFIEGPSLRQLIQENNKGLPIWDLVQIGWQIADVLVYSHNSGVLHRDLKPDNILLTHSIRPNRPYRAIVTDFGLVKLGQGSLLETQEGISLGTPAYMSPEQCRGIDVDGRTDLYALGVILYEMATGQRPYPIRTVFDAAKFHSSGKLVSPKALNSAVTEDLDLLIRLLLAPSLDTRIATAELTTDKLQEIMAALSKAGAVSTAVQERIQVEEEPKEAPPAPQGVSSTPTMAPAVEVDTHYFVQVAYQGVLEEKVYPLGEEPVIVGRLLASDIVLDRPEQRYVSKRHCEILVRNKRVLIRDLGSTNGTMLGSEPLQTNAFREWTPNVEVILGPFTLSLRTSQQLQEVPSPPVGESAQTGSGMPITQVQSSIKLYCPNAVPSRLPLSSDHPILIGRADDCDMVLDHPHVSKRHCRVQLSAGGVEIVDLRSTNGTYLDEQRLPPHNAVPWRPQAKFRIGPFYLSLEETTA